MALNTELAGKVYETSTYEVTAEAIEAYAAATNEDNPAFKGPDAVAPPCFPIVPAGNGLGQAMLDTELNANIALLVHGEEEHLLHKPIKAGDNLSVSSKLESVEIKDTGETFTVLCTLTDDDGDTAAELRSLMFIRGTASGKRPSSSGDEPEHEIVFKVDQTIDEDQTYRYAEASGDHNLIHVDEDFAKNTAGLPGIIVHGMCTMAFVGKVVLDETCGGDPSRLRKLKVRFSRPVLPGQTITTKGWQVSDSDEGKTYGFETTNPGGVAVIRNGVAEVAV